MSYIGKMRDRPYSINGIMVYCYIGILIYGTLYPLTGWQIAPDAWSKFADSIWPRYLTRTDVVNNLLIYIPAGLLLTLRFLRRFSFPRSMLLSLILCLLLSLALEIMQLALPQRIASLLDTLLNTAGAVIGAAVAAIISKQTRIGLKAHTIGYQFFRAGAQTETGLMIILVWALSLLSPFDFTNPDSLDKFIAHALGLYEQPATFMGSSFLFYFASVILIERIFARISQANLNHQLLTVSVVLLLSLLQLLFSGRYLSVEGLLGTFCGLGMTTLVHSVSKEQWLENRGILAALIIMSIMFNPHHYETRLFGAAENWIPFRDHINTRFGIAEIANSLWPFMLACFFVITRRQSVDIGRIMISGTLIILFISMLIEWGYQPEAHTGKFDITYPLLAASGWLFTGLYMRLRASQRLL